jgi:hypothetical protein
MTRTQSIQPAAEALKGRSRTALYDWLWRHYDALPEYRRYRVDWAKMTAFLTEIGMTGRDENKPLNADTVRMTYMRVRADKLAETQAPAGRARQSSARPSPARPKSSPTAAQPHAKPPPDPPADYDESDFGSFVRNR